jgi:rubrerythrin
MKEKLEGRYIEGILRARRGRAFFLNLLADAEIEDEGMVFEELLSRVDDAELKKMVKIHHEDEKRHNKMLLACVEKNGGAPPVPEELRIAHRVDAELGGFADAFTGGRRGVMEAYVLLLVLEERAVKQFPYVVEVLRRHDPESATVLERVLRDEERHVLYARAISRRYAPDAETLAETTARFRAAEERAFAGHIGALTRYTLDHGLVDLRLPERLFWRALVRLSA